MKKVFLSHSSEDKFFVRELAKRLEAANVKVWIDEAEIKVGDSLIQKISQGIEESPFLVAVLSKNSTNSRWVARELELALNTQIRNNSVEVLPVLLDDCVIPPFLQDRKYADFRNPDKFNESFRDLLNALGAPQPVFPSFEAQGVKLGVKVWGPTRADSSTTAGAEIGSSLVDFEDIRVVDVDQKNVYKPDKTKEMYHVRFTLSASPPTDWTKIFETERMFARHQMWRKAWVDTNAIVVHCALPEVKQYHAKDIQADVLSTNTKYREYLFEQERKKTSADQSDEKRRRDIGDALGGLIF